ncbi:MAG: DUF4894 domain-containing protein [Thermosipho sp. (in: Bacteria)]|nr:DUF4894 domain-containing protein [Thermosipho sp. (in: thermotogales)]
MKKAAFLVIIVLIILLVNTVVFIKLNKNIFKINTDSHFSPAFILPYKNKLWLMNRNGQIFGLIQDLSDFRELPVLRIPDDFIDEINGKVNLNLLKYLPENIPSIVYEINFFDNSIVLLNNSKVYFEDVDKLVVYFEKLKILYKYMESDVIYYIKDDMLVKVR